MGFETVPQRRRRWMRKRLREQGNRCAYCGVNFENLEAGKPTADHYIPLGKGGMETFSNIVAACSPCNHKKANTMPAPDSKWWLGPPKTDSIDPDYQSHISYVCGPNGRGTNPL